MSTIKIHVSTNNDEDKMIKFPIELGCRPMIGDRIRSIDHFHSRKIVRIEHAVNWKDGTDNGPMLMIEVTR